MIRALEGPFIFAIVYLIPVYLALVYLQIPPEKFQPFLMLCCIGTMGLAAICAAIAAFRGTTMFLFAALIILGLAHLPPLA